MSVKAWRFAVERTQSWGVVSAAEGNRRVPVGSVREIGFDTGTARTTGFARVAGLGLWRVI